MATSDKKPEFLTRLESRIDDLEAEFSPPPAPGLPIRDLAGRAGENSPSTAPVVEILQMLQQHQARLEDLADRLPNLAGLEAQIRGINRAISSRKFIVLDRQMMRIGMAVGAVFLLALGAVVGAYVGGN